MADGKNATGLTDPLCGKQFANKWTVVETLAKGGTATVYRGRDENTGYRVAIKVLHPHLVSEPKIVQRFLREVGAASQVDHPHVGKILDWGRVDEAGVVFIISEFLSGETLEEAIGDPPYPMPFGRIREIGRGILRALIAAHEQGVIHRDLKPANVFLVKDAVSDDFVKVIDFGIAKIMSGEFVKLTQQDQAIGTPLYMSPEQCCGRPVGPQSDLYSLGIILYEMATGQVPFPGFDEEGNDRGLTAVVTDHADQTKAAPPPHRFRPEIPPELELVIMRALTKKLDERIESAAEFYLALSKAVPADSDEDSQRVSRVALEQRTKPRMAAQPHPPRLLPKYGDGPAKGTTPGGGNSTPTHLIDGAAAAARSASDALGRAKTIAPLDLAQETAQPRRKKTLSVTARYLAALLIFGVALGLSTIILPSRSTSEESDAADGAEVTRETAAEARPADAAAEATDEATTKHDEVDVIVIPRPIFVPMPPSRDAEAETTKDATDVSEADAGAGEDAALTEATEAEVMSPPTPPAGYDEHLARGEEAMEARRWRQAADEFKAATELWPEGATAWRGLGNALLSLFKRDEGEAAIRRYLELAPNAADAPYFRSLIGEEQ